MASFRFRRAVVAVLFCAGSAVASPVLNFHDTDFRANLEYNDGVTSSSEPDTAPDGQSLSFVHGGDPGDNEMLYPSTQIWGVGTTQDPPPNGGEVVTLEFQILNRNASPILTDSPLTISLEALNTDDFSALAVYGPVTIDVALTTTFLDDPQELTWDVDWTWSPTPSLLASEYDLTINLAEDWGDVLFGLDPDSDVNGLKISFDVILPEPPTFVLMAASMALYRRRRRG